MAAQQQPVIIYGAFYSTCSQKVVCACYELGVPFELVHVDLKKGEQKSVKHIGRQPFGKVPALDDQGFMLYESVAICRYLDEKSGYKLVPRDPKEMALVEEWISNLFSYYDDNIFKIAGQRIFNQMRGLGPDEAVIKQAVAQLNNVLPILDNHLQNNHFIGGKHFSLADVLALPYFQSLSHTPEGQKFFADYKYINAWFLKSKK